jgi:membrane dipeptidase
VKLHPQIAQIALILLVACGLGALPAAAQKRDPHLALAKRVLRSTPLIDGHNDLPWRIREDSIVHGDVEAYNLYRPTPGMTDIARLRKGMVGAQFWSIYIPGEIKDSGYARVQLEQFDIARRFIAKYPRSLRLVTTARGIRQAFAARRIGSLLGLEGGHAIENSLGALRTYYELGARYMTLTHNVTLDWADAALDSAKHGGLTRFGEAVVQEMNRLGMLVDLSHVSPGTMSDALNVTQAPVIFSHSGARALVDHRRNVPDSILARLPKNGGIVMVPFVTSFVSAALHAWDDSVAAVRRMAQQQLAGDTAAIRRQVDAWSARLPRPQVTIADVANHIEHIRKVAGVDHVGIGSDFDGIEETIEGLEDVSTFPALFAELARRRWTATDLRKLAGENLLRVLAQAERVSKRLRRSEPPSTKTILQLDGAARPH